MSLLPLPEKIERKPGTFHLTSGTSIITDDPNQWNAKFLHDLLAPSTGLPLPILQVATSRANSIGLQTEPALAFLGIEGYRLEISVEGVKIFAPTTAGVFYGIQTLRQLLPPEVEERHSANSLEWNLPCQVITDQPRFPWRGFMLDEGRHFQGMETVLQTLDMMAFLKLNRFHWHLTDDQGWRIEIKKYPRLTEVGSRRSGSTHSFTDMKHDGIPHGGFYTQEQIRAVVAYAAERNITVVPEIELPGHSTAALAAYPELSCTGGPFEVSTRFGIHNEVYCAGRESTFTLLVDVLDEILELFPSPWIHIGGDEVPKARWKACPECQERIQKNGLKDEEDLQVYFTNRILAALHSRGRHGVGWNEILQPGLVPGAVVQYWARGWKKLIASINTERRQVIMSPILHTYLDYDYSLLPLRSVYNFEPVPAGLDEAASANILGVEAPLWTEWVADRPRFYFQLYPRLLALAEVGWTARRQKHYPDFVHRLEGFLPRLDKMDIGYVSIEKADPSRLRRIFGFLTIFLPKKKSAHVQGKS